MRFTRRLILKSGAIGAVAVGGLFERASADPAGPKPPLLGLVTAPKRLVVWGSYTCPFTGQLFTILRGILKDMPHAASVEWHHFPTHPPDPALHVAGLGFHGKHFWNFTFAVLDLVFATNGNYDGLTNAKLIQFAKAAGGSEKTLQAAYANKANWTTVKEDLLAGRLLGISRTPGLFYNGYFMTPGGLPLDFAAFDKSLRAMLKAG